MNSGITKRTLFLKCVLLFLCMPAATALLSGACPQTPPSPASEEPAERQISTTENLPELVRSLNELQALQLSHGYQYYKVDLEDHNQLLLALFQLLHN